MMDKNHALYQFILDHAPDMTDQWLSHRQVNGTSVYSADVKPEIEAKLRKQNGAFIEAISKVWVEDGQLFEEQIRNWTFRVAEDRVKISSPIYETMEQFKIFRSIYLRQIEAFASVAEYGVTVSDAFAWTSKINHAFDSIITAFTRHYYETNLEQLKAQQETINELGTPVIPITKEIGVLPLIGDIDTQRAAAILESTLKQCSENQCRQLFIDLSGVRIMDTMVAQQIFKVVSALGLIGVKATISGIRPEVAQTAIQLGIDFHQVPVQNNLARALAQTGVLQ